MEDLTSRKFVSTILVILLAYGLVFTNKLEAEAWLNMATVAIGLYGGLNVAQKVIKKE